MNTVLFLLGKFTLSPKHAAFLEDQKIDPNTYLHRHQSGDWQHMCETAVASNNEAVKNNGRILSIYTIGDDLAICIITDIAFLYTRMSVTRLFDLND